MATDFLQSLFGENEALTYEQLTQKIEAAKMNLANIADGSYVSRAKFDDRVKELDQKAKDLQGQITQRDTDMKGLQDQLTAAQADAGKLTEVQKSLTSLQTKYAQDQKDWEAKSKKQAKEFMVREKANTLHFSSAAAKRDFIREANSKDFNVDGETLLGYEDFVTKYKADNEGAIIEQKPATPDDGKGTTPPKIVAPAGSGKSAGADNKNPFNFGFIGVRPKPKDE